MQFLCSKSDFSKKGKTKYESTYRALYLTLQSIRIIVEEEKRRFDFQLGISLVTFLLIPTSQQSNTRTKQKLKSWSRQSRSTTKELCERQGSQQSLVKPQAPTYFAQ